MPTNKSKNRKKVEDKKWHGGEAKYQTRTFTSMDTTNYLLSHPSFYASF